MSALKICPQCGTEYELDQRFCPKDGSTLKMQGGSTGDLVGSIVADRYHILKKLGEGGMGTVYLAEHVKMGRKSAVKVMNPGMGEDPDAISRFNREAANASKIGHPNVASVYDFGETADGLIYLAMEFIEGPSLTKVIEAGPLEPHRAADITRQAADALAVAHDMGIVHRDLKPDNIMLAKSRDGGDVVKVVDFGIAKAANNEAQKVTKTGMVVGTPEYMSPEQLAGDKLDGRSDTYSLALVAFNMLTGKLPFPAETAQEAMIMRLTDEPKTLSEMKPDVPWTGEMQAVMNKALMRDANDRYATASEFGRDLFKAAQGLPRGSAQMAGTAVISAPAAGAPSHAATVAKTAKLNAVPATRVSSATPVNVAAHKDTESGGRSKMPYMVGAGVVAAAAVVFAVVSMRPKSSAGAPAQQEGTAQTGGNVAAAPVVNFSREFEDIGHLVDQGDPASGSTALTRLATLETAATAASTPDSTFLQFR